MLNENIFQAVIIVIRFNAKTLKKIANNNIDFKSFNTNQIKRSKTEKRLSGL